MKNVSEKHRKFKKWFILLMMAVLVVNLAVILGYTLGGQKIQETDPEESGDLPTLTYALNTLRGSTALNRYLQEFEAQGMTMEPLSIPADSYTEELNLLLLAGKGPDVFEVPPSRSDTYYRKQWLRPLTLPGGTVNALTENGWLEPVEGDIYAVPTHIQTVWLVCNQSLLDKAGVDSPPTSLEEFKTAAEDITSSNRGYGRYGFLLPMNGNQEYALSLIEKMAAAGGDVFWKEETEEFQFENLEPYFTALSAMQTSEALSPDYQMATHESAFLQFVEGNIGMMLMDNRQIHALEAAQTAFPYAVSLPPTAEGREASVVQTPEGFLAVHADSSLTESDVSRLFSSELFACITEDDGFQPISQADFHASSFAETYGFTQSGVQRLLFKNNVYTYQRFSLYTSILEAAGDGGGAEGREKLSELSRRLSGSPAAKR